tara:strand:+ start:207 stop:560 length:354 start_codon:yes stop_codon:yes gene_type:complete
MVKIINNLWSMIKMVIILIFMLVGVHFVGTEKLVETGLICLGFYSSYKLIELLSVYLKNKINGVKMDKTVKVVEEINPEIKYIEGLINEIKKKAKKTVKDKNTLDLLGIKLKQLKNV